MPVNATMAVTRCRDHHGDGGCMKWPPLVGTTGPLPMIGRGRAPSFVMRLMRLMGIAALGPKAKTTKPAPGTRSSRTLVSSEVYMALSRSCDARANGGGWRSPAATRPRRRITATISAGARCIARSTPAALPTSASWPPSQAPDHISIYVQICHRGHGLHVAFASKTRHRNDRQRFIAL